VWLCLYRVSCSMLALFTFSPASDIQLSWFSDLKYLMTSSEHVKVFQLASKSPINQPSYELPNPRGLVLTFYCTGSAVRGVMPLNLKDYFSETRCGCSKCDCWILLIDQCHFGCLFSNTKCPEELSW